MRDYLLEISFDARDTALEDEIQSRLFLTATTGSTSNDVNGTLTISAYFDEPEQRDAAMDALRDVDAIELHATERERVDWLDLYQQSLEPLVIGTRFIVAPDAALLPDAVAHGADRLTIVVPQEQAFGSGSHETTSLCIELLETLPVRGARGLDIGAGSGILAIAMHRLGAAKVIAFDNDPDAYGALRDNRIRNEVAESALPLFIGSVEALRAGAFDVLTMNIIPEVIVPMLGDVVRHMARDARLLVSGILVVKRDEVVAAAGAHGLQLIDEREKGEWWAGVLGML
ncbi:MAG: 50S ribosomal protein L11 methyltransferase [Acidobacteria bacterium]|nr:50S ribosomal protein L11 methyltransferase [Acidobacteriota bacterium]MBV9478411.1 50S ribosomal protein L11 methyltransferase [Acidobacteriota bacterium]